MSADMTLIQRVEQAYANGQQIAPEDAREYVRHLLESGHWVGLEMAVIQVAVGEGGK
jgi:hypothetical protein